MKSAMHQAYELLLDPDRWCQGSMAMNDRGSFENPFSEDAVKWCASGASAITKMSREEDLALVAAAKALFPSVARVVSGSFGPVVAVNDVLGHEALMQCFEKALVEMEGSL